MSTEQSDIYTNEELFMAGKIEDLYKKNSEFMYYIINKFSNMKLEEDDFIGCCNIAFTKALKNYNPSKSRWVTFFGKIIINEIIQEKRLCDKRIKTVSFEEFRYKFYGSDSMLKIEDSALSSEEDTMNKVINQISREEVLHLVDRLPERKRKILNLHLQGKSQREIAMIMNISRAYAGKIIRNTILELKKSYDGRSFSI